MSSHNRWSSCAGTSLRSHRSYNHAIIFFGPLSNGCVQSAGQSALHQTKEVRQGSQTTALPNPDQDSKHLNYHGHHNVDHELCHFLHLPKNFERRSTCVTGALSIWKFYSLNIHNVLLWSCLELVRAAPIPDTNPPWGTVPALSLVLYNTQIKELGAKDEAA